MKTRILAVSICIYFSPMNASAGVFSDIWGILTDPFKLGKGTSNMIEAVERAAIHAERIEGKINNDVADRLKQIDDITKSAIKEIDTLADNTLTKVDEIATRSFNKIEVLQQEIISNTSNLVKCTTEVTVDIALSKISNSLNDLGLRRPRVTIFGRTLLEVKFDKSDFDSPITGWRKYYSLMKGRLDSILPQDSAKSIVDLYGELQRTADLVRCHYKNDNGLFMELYETELEFNRRGRFWVGMYDQYYQGDNR